MISGATDEEYLRRIAEDAGFFPTRIFISQNSITLFAKKGYKIPARIFTDKGFKTLIQTNVCKLQSS